MRIPHVAAFALSLLLLAGCGGDDDEGGQSSKGRTETAPSAAGAGGASKAAAAFKACFDAEGYKAEAPATVLGAAPLLAKTKGYDVAQVFVNSDRGALYTSSVTFFDSPAELAEAKRKLKLDFGSADVPEADERGATVVEYTTKQSRDARDEILICLSTADFSSG